MQPGLGNLLVGRQEDNSRDACGSAVGRECSGGVSGGRTAHCCERHVLLAQAIHLTDKYSHTKVLEVGGRKRRGGGCKDGAKTGWLW